MPSPRNISLPALRELAARYGIQPEHNDMFGQRTVASADSLLDTLRALGAAIHRAEDIATALHERELRPWKRGVEPVAVAWNGRCPDLVLRLEAARAKGKLRCRIVSESGSESGEATEWDGRLEDFSTKESAELDGRRYVAKKIPVHTRLPLGYHHFEAECAAGRFECLLISAPPRAFDTRGKSWGMFLPLYALHTEASWGAGDLFDLKRLRDWAAAQGAGVVAILPMLAAFLDKPLEISPYVPASRLFWNELYVDPRQAPEFAQAPAAARLANAHFWQQDIEKMRRRDRVDHGRLMALKRPLLDAMARWLSEAKPERYGRFQEYVNAHPRLKDYAAFRAAAERQQGKPWTAWPQRLRGGKLQSGDYEPAAEQYHLYAQWLAEEQMQAVAAKGGKDTAGLYLDFPLGVHPDGYDVWRHREVFATGAEAGAPPDSLFTKGQKWGFPPLHPEALRRTSYAYLIACLRQQFEHSSWVRLDHVMGLHRLFWIPSGRAAKEGVYVRYHPEEWYAIVCLESHRSKTVVVGENLGTVPPEVTREMGRRGLKPMYVLQYEAQPSEKKPLRDVPANAAASLNTHDMPPFASFWNGSDLKDLAELGVFDAKEARDRLAARREMCTALERFLLGKQGTIGSKSAAGSVAKVMAKALEWLAASDAKLLLVNLEDLWLETEPQNVPGTNRERPNWQRKARLSFEQFAQDPRVISLLQAIARRRSNRQHF